MFDAEQKGHIYNAYLDGYCNAASMGTETGTVQMNDLSISEKLAYAQGLHDGLGAGQLLVAVVDLVLQVGAQLLDVVALDHVAQRGHELGALLGRLTGENHTGDEPRSSGDLIAVVTAAMQSLE